MQRRPERSTDPHGPPRGDPPGKAASVEPAELAGLGLTLAASIALFAIGGNWLDGKLGTSPLFVLVGTFLGFAGGFYSLYAKLVLRPRREGREEDHD